MTELIFYSIYVFVTFMYGTVFTLLFLDISICRRNVCFFCLFSCISFFFQWLLGCHISYDTLIAWYPLVVHLPLLFLCIWVYKCSFVTSLSSIFLAYFLTSPRYVLGDLINRLFPAIPYPDVSGRIIASFLLSALIAVFILKPIKYAFKRPQKDVALFFYPLIAVYMTSYLLVTYTDLLQYDSSLALEIIYTMFFFFILYYIQKYFVTLDEKIRLENEQHFLELSTDSISKQIGRLNASNEQIRILRHDVRHFCNVIMQYVNEGNVDEIKKYTGEITNSVNTLTPKVYCQNSVVNSIISSYIEPFERLNCPVTTQINIPENIFVANTDLCIILANALENAYHSCEKVAAPFLNVKLDTTSNRLFLNISNACESNITFIDGLPTVSSAGHGYGTKSIALITEKYNGLYDFSAENHVFTLKVILHAMS